MGINYKTQLKVRGKWVDTGKVFKTKNEAYWSAYYQYMADVGDENESSDFRIKRTLKKANYIHTNKGDSKCLK